VKAGNSSIIERLKYGLIKGKTMTDKQDVDKRLRILSTLRGIVEASKLIGDEMQNIRHEGGIAHKSLKPKSGMYALHDNNGGIYAKFQDTNGEWYKVEISPVEGR